MYHRTRWTPEKIKQRLELIAPLVYRKQKALPSFRYHELNGPLLLSPVGANVDDSNWQEINAHEYWGSWMQDFVLRTTFTIPEDWDTSQPIALYLPLGEAGDFSHGEHQFKYSLYPHAGSWNEDTQKEAYLLNDPIVVHKPNIEGQRSEKQISNLQSLVSVSKPNVIIETIKRAEDGDGIIIRLYESQRKRGQVQVRMGFAVASAWETNLLEENESELSVENDSIHLNLRPYQIMTIRLRERA